jgi:Na+-transporting NADH:ubiquinone oxidoreductase subunit C
MNKNSNTYTFGFSAALVVVVGILLAVAATGLKPYQDKNIRIEKMQNIIGTVGVEASPAEAETLFNQYITDQLILNSEGEIVTGLDVTAFDLDLAKELKKKTADRYYPLFKSEMNGDVFYIVPMRGQGLWGPVWGYIAMDGKGNIDNVYGAKFDHKTETPGLGAEINTSQFQNQFVGKKIFDADGNFAPIKAVKGGVAPGNLHEVDAISGGTITSNGVNEMIERSMRVYVPYFKSVAEGTVTVKELDEETAPEPETIAPDAAGGISPEAHSNGRNNRK